MANSDCKIGFVGVGRMGGNMAQHLNDEGFNVVSVYDINEDVAKQTGVAVGAAVAATPAQVAEAADVVITVVTNDAAMRAIFAENDDRGLLANGQGRIFINCATLSPQVHIDIEALVTKAGGKSLEACMASSITQAREGTLYLMCGGRKETFDEVKPVLESLSTKLRYVGEAGQAAQVKALVNMVMNINTAGLAEGLGLGHAQGLDLSMLREIFSETGANSRVLETDGEDMQNREHDCYFSAEHASKDSGIALDLAKAAGLKLPLAEAAKSQYDKLIAAGKGDLDKSGVAELTFPGRN